jgi:hypothetical protein
MNTNKFYQLPLNKTILLLGNSHPESAVNDSLINELVNISSGGESYFYSAIKGIKILKANPQIKTVLIEYSNNSISKEMDEWIWGDKYIKNRYPKYSHLIGFYEQFYLLSHNPISFLKIQPLSFKIKLNFLFYNKSNLILDDNWGKYNYLVRDKTDSLVSAIKPTELTGNSKIITSKDNIYFLNELIKYCQTNNINIILIRCPLHKLYPKSNEKLFVKNLNENLNNVKFIDFKNYPLSNSEFADLEHLNFRGANKFSKKLDSVIKSGI